MEVIDSESELGLGLGHPPFNVLRAVAAPSLLYLIHWDRFSLYRRIGTFRFVYSINQPNDSESFSLLQPKHLCRPPFVLRTLRPPTSSYHLFSIDTLRLQMNLKTFRYSLRKWVNTPFSMICCIWTCVPHPTGINCTFQSFYRSNNFLTGKGPTCTFWNWVIQLCLWNWVIHRDYLMTR